MAFKVPLCITAEEVFTFVEDNRSLHLLLLGKTELYSEILSESKGFSVFLRNHL